MLPCGGRKNLLDPGRVSWVRYVLYRSCTSSHNGRLGSIWSRSWSIWSIWSVWSRSWSIWSVRRSSPSEKQLYLIFSDPLIVLVRDTTAMAVWWGVPMLGRLCCCISPHPLRRWNRLALLPLGATSGQGFTVDIRFVSRTSKPLLLYISSPTE